VVSMSAAGPTIKVVSAVSYGICSIVLVMVNKRILYTYKFGSPVVLLLLHLSFSITLLELSKRVGLLSIRPFEWRLAFKMFPLSLIFVLNILVSFFALSRTSVPMFTTLRRMTTMFVLLAQWKILGLKPSSTVIQCVLLMMAGAGLAGLSDLSFDPLGYLCVFVNNSLTAGYLVSMKYYFGSLKLQAVEVLRYNCAMSIPLIAVLCVVDGRVHAVLTSPAMLDKSFLIVFLMSGFLAFAVNFTTYWCTQVNNPLTTSVTGQLKNILTTMMGMLLFPDVHINPTFLFGIGVGTIGGILYSVHKFMESQREKKEDKISDPEKEEGDAPNHGGGDIDMDILKSNGINKNINVNGIQRIHSRAKISSVNTDLESK